MSGIRDRLAHAWERLNPREPSPLFLAKFMAFALSMFVLAYAIGAST